MNGKAIVSIIFLVSLLTACQRDNLFEISEEENAVAITTANYQIKIDKEGFRYAIMKADGKEIAKAHKVSGLLISKNDNDPVQISRVELYTSDEDQVVFTVETQEGLKANVNLHLHAAYFKLAVSPQEEGKYFILARTSGISPAYGLADHGAQGNGKLDKDVRCSDNLTGLALRPMRGDHRMISNFAIFPQVELAQVNMEPGDKIVRFTREENAQGSMNVRSLPSFYYFVGTPKEIYQSYLDVRNAEGYKVFKPKYAWFDVGWEAFGALAWSTNYKTVTENVNQYLAYGYPLRWMVVGSGFWPSSSKEFDEHGTPYSSDSDSEEAKKLQATTSFGMWDPELYPNPKEFINYFHDKGLVFIIGLRIGFIPGGPFTDEGLANDYFIKNDSGEAALFKAGFPKSPIHLLDTKNPTAVDWYVNLSQKWMDYGVDGFKEDLFNYPQTLPDDLIDPVNRALMEKGVYIMARNNYLGSPADIHRYQDFNYNQPQDRGPLNGLAYAYSGFPYVYPDIVGGTGLATGRFGDVPKEKMRIYLMRYAQYAALNPSMSFGYGPWLFDEETNRVALEAARLHDRLLPYIYDAALDAYETGYPYTLTPLPIAYPDDPQVYHLADSTRRSYQWLIGESLLATPLYGNDYATANGRDVYLPKGKWMDYDTGELYEGPTTLRDFPLPIGKTPLFVGGKGIVIEQKEGVLKARVYPLTSQVEMEFKDKDGETVSRISIEEPDWTNPDIFQASTAEKVSYAKVNHAFEFTLLPGQDYLVR